MTTTFRNRAAELLQQAALLRQRGIRGDTSPEVNKENFRARRELAKAYMAASEAVELTEVLEQQLSRMVVHARTTSTMEEWKDEH